MSNLSPCYGCKDRVVGCHSNCIEYLAYYELMQQVRDNRAAFVESRQATHTASMARTRQMRKMKNF